MSIKPVKITTKGFGTMSMTWTPAPPPLEQSLETLKYVREKYGVKFYNGSTFYHIDPEFHNLKLISQFLKTQEDVSDFVISIKTGFVPPHTFDGSKKHIDEEIQGVKEWFKGLEQRPKILMQLGRVDKSVPYEESIKAFYDNVKAGLIDGISLSEVSAESISKAVATAPVSALEVEVSLFSQDIFHNGVLAEAAKHNIPIVAYSPLARGILTDVAAETKDFPETLSETDRRKGFFDRFRPDIWEKNKPRLDKLYEFAKSKGISLECLALSYLEALSGIENFQGIEKFPQVIPIPSGSTKDKIDKNFNTVELSRDDLDALHKIIDETPIYGSRYNADHEPLLNG